MKNNTTDTRQRNYTAYVHVVDPESRLQIVLNALMRYGKVELDDPTRQYIITFTTANYGHISTAFIQRIGSGPRGNMTIDLYEACIGYECADKYYTVEGTFKCKGVNLRSKSSYALYNECYNILKKHAIQLEKEAANENK